MTANFNLESLFIANSVSELCCHFLEFIQTVKYESLKINTVKILEFFVGIMPTT